MIENECEPPAWVATLQEAAGKIDEGLALLRGGPLSFYLRKAAGAAEYLIDRFSPFRAGERVVLTAAPEITESVAPGWMSAKHFLVQGAPARVVSVDCDEHGFLFGLEFEEETYIYDGQEKPVESKHHFTFRERFLSHDYSANDTWRL